MKWISVKDKLPKEHQKVLCYALEQHFIGTCVRNCQTNKLEIELERFEEVSSDVTHWMSLPDEPKLNA